MLQQVQSWPGLRIDVTANGYTVRRCNSSHDDRGVGIDETHVFESFEGVVAHLRGYLPIYPAMQPTLTTTARKR